MSWIRNTGFHQFCGSESGSGAFLAPGAGSAMNNPNHISESLDTTFGLKYLNSLMRIRDPWWKKFGSGINIPDLQHWFSPGLLIWLSWIRILNRPKFLPFIKAFLPLLVCFLTYYLLWASFFSKNSTFCDFKVWPGSGSGSAHGFALVWLLGSGSALRIRNTGFHYQRLGSS